MLFIDRGSGVTSARQFAAPFPYVLKDFRGQALAAGAFLTRRASMDWLVPALIREISSLGTTVRTSDCRGAEIVDEVAGLIAAGSVQVAESLRGKASLAFFRE